MQKESKHKYIRAYYNRQIVLVSSAVAEMIGIKDGHIIKNDDELWSILKQNADYMIAFCKAMLSNKN